jgi:hypothetical protein
MFTYRENVILVVISAGLGSHGSTAGKDARRYSV